MEECRCGLWPARRPAGSEVFLLKASEVFPPLSCLGASRRARPRGRRDLMASAIRHNGVFGPRQYGDWRSREIPLAVVRAPSGLLCAALVTCRSVFTLRHSAGMAFFGPANTEIGVPGKFLWRLSCCLRTPLCRARYVPFCFYAFAPLRGMAFLGPANTEIGRSRKNSSGRQGAAGRGAPSGTENLTWNGGNWRGRQVRVGPQPSRYSVLCSSETE